MNAAGFAVAFVGYTTFVYGFSQVRGCNAGYLDLLWPGRYKGCLPDGGGGGGKTGPPPCPPGTSKPVGGKCPPGLDLINGCCRKRGAHPGR